MEKNSSSKNLYLTAELLLLCLLYFTGSPFIRILQQLDFGSKTDSRDQFQLRTINPHHALRRRQGGSLHKA